VDECTCVFALGAVNANIAARLLILGASVRGVIVARREIMSEPLGTCASGRYHVGLHKQSPLCKDWHPVESTEPEAAASRPAAGEDEGKHFVPDRGHCKYCHKSDSLHLPDGRCPAAGEPSERESAVRIANCVLDKPYIDPDGDECVVARQFLRAIEREAARAAVPAAPDVRKLLDAAMLLRIAARKLKRGDGSAACFADKIADFLKRNGLQGSILRGDSGERKP